MWRKQARQIRGRERIAGSRTGGFRVAAAVALSTWLATASLEAAAQEEDLRAKTQNPVGNLISVPLESNFDFGAPNGTAYIGNLQPVIPFRLGDWNLINRTILPLVSVEGLIDGTPEIPQGAAGTGREFGLGDLNYSLFFSPAEVGKFIWGVGPSVTLPTASYDEMGSGKYSAGPTGVVLAQPAPWSFGVLARQLWSIEGKSDREQVSQFLIQPFVNFNLDDGWFLFSDPSITANWKRSSDQRWTVPLGGGVGRLFKIGEQPINTRLGAFYNLEKPDNAPDWAVKFTFQLLFPK